MKSTRGRPRKHQYRDLSVLLAYQFALDYLSTPDADSWDVDHGVHADGSPDPERWHVVRKAASGRFGGNRQPRYREELDREALARQRIVLRGVPVRVDVRRGRGETEDKYIERLAAPSPGEIPVGILLGAWEFTAPYRPDYHAPIPANEPLGPPAPPSHEQRLAWAREILSLQRAPSRSRERSPETHGRALRDEIARRVAGHSWNLKPDAVKKVVTRTRARLKAELSQGRHPPRTAP